MLSRVAESLYWMSRYLERSEHTARLLDVHHNLSLELFPEQELEPFLRLLEALQIPRSQIAGGNLPTLEELAFDPMRTESIAYAISAARENARQTREQISSEMFEQVNRIYLYVRDPRTRQEYAAEPHRFYQSIKEGAQRFHGVTNSTMTHGQGWQFIQTGRYIERSGSIAWLIDRQLLPLLAAGDPAEIYLESLGLLKCFTAWEAYCKVYSAELEPIKILQFLLLSREFPHACHFCAEKLMNALRALAKATGTTTRSLEPLVGRLLADLRYTPIEEITSSQGGDPARFLARVRHTLTEAHNLIYHQYLSEHWERSHLSW